MKYLLWILTALTLDLVSAGQVVSQADNVSRSAYIDSLVRNAVLMKSDTVNISRRIDTLYTSRLRAYNLGSITVTQQPAAISLGPRYHTVTGVTGLLATDFIQLYPTADLPTGYMLGDARVTAAGTIRLNVYGPALTLLSPAYSFTCIVIAFR